MRWLFALLAEIVERRNDAAAKELVPNPIHRDAGRQGVCWINDPARQVQSIQLFTARLPAMRNQLGNRVADAWALAARAFDLLGRTGEAQDAYTNATLLAPVMELNRRYPEVGSLAQKYRVAPAPSEMT